jgi:hypothetical protein
MSRAEKRKYHYIYKTVCSITNKFYIGMHSTDDLEDGYKGSGTYLWKSIHKHGKENHVTTILEFFSSREELKNREAQIVNEELISDKRCMNICLGGGGLDYLFAGKKGNDAQKILRENDQEWNNKRSEAISVAIRSNTAACEANTFRLKERHASGSFKYDTFTGKKHSEETKIKISKSIADKQSGEKNSQFGLCWIHSLDEKISKKIPKESVELWTSIGWLSGRKIKFDNATN